MNASAAPAGMAVLCDGQGLIRHVIHDGLGVTGLEVGQPLEHIAEGPSRAKLRSFLVELRSLAAVFDWEVTVRCADRVVPLRLEGAVGQDGLMILGALTPHGMLNLWDELILINNEQTTALRSAIKGQVEATRAQEDNSAPGYAELSRLNNDLVTLQRDLAKKNAELERLYAEMQRLSITDPLTGLYNRRGLYEFGGKEVARAQRLGETLAAIMLDLDYFKEVNDTHGHPVGDQVLEQVAQRCAQQLRQMDIIGRYGGEEFAILLPNTELEGARQIAERLRASFATPVRVEIGELSMTLSLGVAVLKSSLADLPALLQAADHALYQAKQAGRNRVALEAVPL